jgi:thymidylate synthase (FAD)
VRKELPNTYTFLDGGAIGVRARTPSGEIIEYEIPKKDLLVEFSFTDSQGTSHNRRAILRPETVKVTRVDNILPDDLQLFYLAATTCYSGATGEELIQRAKEVDRERVERLVREIVASGHLSIVEHGRGPCFFVEGISRSCSHQAVRHRIFTYSQQSQRYVGLFPKPSSEGEAVFPFVIPPGVRAEPELLEHFLGGVRGSLSSYYSLMAGGLFPEDARFLLPNAAVTRMVESGNYRAFMEMIPKRTCARAQWEIDMVATEIAHQLSQDLPDVFRQVGPACSLGKCDQGKRSCGVPLNKPLSAFFGDPVYPHDHLIFGMH